MTKPTVRQVILETLLTMLDALILVVEDTEDSNVLIAELQERKAAVIQAMQGE